MNDIKNYNVCGWMSAILLAALMPYCSADDTDNASKSQTPEVGNQLNVNWLYGPYIPKDVPLRSLTLEQRWKLYVRMTYTTPGIYIKTIAFAIRDQVTDIPHQWGDGGEGFAKRFGLTRSSIRFAKLVHGLGRRTWRI